MAEEFPWRKEQAAADRAIREALGGIPEPRLSLFFDRRLEIRLARERLRKRSLRRWKRALQLYWLSAAVGSAVVVLRLPMDVDSVAGSPVLLATLACGAVLPSVLLLAALQKDPIELVFEMLDWLT
jgi:hypothetical protein